MKKFFITVGLFVTLTTTSLLADDLKNTLMPVASKSSESNINLDNLNVGARPGPVAKPKVRSGKAVIGTVDGIKIYKKSADQFLKMVTKGKVTDFDRLPKKQRIEIVNNLASTALIEAKAKKEVTQAEKNKLAAQYWMGKKMKKIKVSDAEAKKFYKANQKAFERKDGKTVSYENVEKYVKSTMQQQKFAKDLMKNAKVVVK